jgi:hypothetical protein
MSRMLHLTYPQRKALKRLRRWTWKARRHMGLKVLDATLNALELKGLAEHEVRDRVFFWRLTQLGASEQRRLSQ